MTAQHPLVLVPAGALQIGEAVALVQDQDGGRVFIRGELVFAWDDGDELGRRLAAVQLVRIKAARAVQVAGGFGVNTETLRRWQGVVTDAGVGALAPSRRGPKGPSRLTHDLVADIAARRRAGASLRTIAKAVGVSEASVRRVLPKAEPAPATTEPAANPEPDQGADLPVLPDPADRCDERVAARWGALSAAPPVFAPAARVPLAGLLLAIPALETTGLLSCAATVFGGLPNGFYGLDTMLTEGVLRTLAGEPRAEGASRLDPFALGRVLGLDRAPEVKTIRRKITALAATGKADELLAAIATHHVARLDATNPDLAAVFYVDGHVRAYQGTRKVAKTHITAWTYAILAVPILLLPAALRRRDDQALNVATYVGATSVLLSLVGFLRWVFVVPPLARSYVAGDSTTRAAVDAAWTAQHQLGGALLGEHLGQLLANAWSLTLSVIIVRSKILPRWLGLTGLVVSLLYLLNQGDVVATAVPGFPVWDLAGLVGSTGWDSGWAPSESSW